MNENIENHMFDYLSRHLSPARFEHSCNVAALAVVLATEYNVDVLKAQTAGLMHDCAKYMTNEEFVDFLKKRKKTFKYFKEMVKFYPRLLHSYAGEIIVKERFKIRDKDILNAIRNHTQGRENMSVLEKVIFVADSISDDRKLKCVKELQNMAKENLDKVFLKMLAKKIRDIIDQDIYLSPQIVNTWNWYVSRDKK